MNYLAHQYLARRIRPEPDAPALFFAGNVLPDLLAIAGDGRLRTAGEHIGPLPDGVRLHLQTDQKFHSAPAFHQAQELASHLLRDAAWETPPKRRFFLAHVMTELTLDAVLLARHPGLPDDLYGQLAESLEIELAPLSRGLAGREVPNLERSVERFIRSRFLYDYATPAGLASSLIGISRRVGIPNFAEARDAALLGGIFEDFSALIAPLADQLLSLSPAKPGGDPGTLVVQ